MMGLKWVGQMERTSQLEIGRIAGRMQNLVDGPDYNERISALGRVAVRKTRGTPRCQGIWLDRLGTSRS